MHAYNPCTGESKAEGLWTPGKSGLHTETWTQKESSQWHNCWERSYAEIKLSPLHPFQTTHNHLSLSPGVSRPLTSIDTALTHAYPQWVYDMHVHTSFLLTQTWGGKCPVNLDLSWTSWSSWNAYCVLKSFPPRWDVLSLRKLLHKRDNGTESHGSSIFSFPRNIYTVFSS